MPGIFGFVTSSFLTSNLDDLGSILKGEYEHLVKDENFYSEDISASRIHLGKIGMKNSPYKNKNIAIWVEGEVYNNADLVLQFGFPKVNFPEALCQAYLNNQLDAYLNKIDGFFTAVLYDSKEKKILLLSDRYGMRMLYYYFKEGHFAWASEPKVLLGLQKIDSSLDSNSLACFMDLGFLVGAKTFFKNIQLLKPASILEFSIENNSYSERYYWKWSEIKPRNLSFDSAVNELGIVFLEAVRKRYSGNNRIGISLSGGLDSRAIFAAVNKLFPDSKGFAFTFGKEACGDVLIASDVVTYSNWFHKIYTLSASNWFAIRLKKIWNSDGMMNMLHMHGSEFLEDISKNIDVNLNGYLGDVVMGGSFLGMYELDQRISIEDVQKIYGEYYKISDWESCFYDIQHGGPVVFMSRARRLTNMGTMNSLSHIEQRKPFFDNHLIELVFSLPDSYRVGNKLYAAMLLKFFPKYFSNIPWQNTGLVVGSKVEIKHRISRRIKFVMMKMGLVQDRNYTNYPDWIRKNDTASKIKNIFNQEPSYLKTYLNIDAEKQYLEPHLKKKKDFSEEVLRAVTLEVYFREVDLDKSKS